MYEYMMILCDKTFCAELLTCPLVLPTTISLHLDIGIIAHSTEKVRESSAMFFYACERTRKRGREIERDNSRREIDRGRREKDSEREK